MAPNKGSGGYIELEIPEGHAINVRSSGDPAMIYPISDDQEMAQENVSLRDNGHHEVSRITRLTCTFWNGKELRLADASSRNFLLA